MHDRVSTYVFMAGKVALIGRKCSFTIGLCNCADAGKRVCIHATENIIIQATPGVRVAKNFNHAASNNQTVPTEQ